MTESTLDREARPSEQDITRSRLQITIDAWREQITKDWRVFRRNRLAMLGIVMIVIFGIMAISHPILMETVWIRGIYHPEVGYDVSVQPWPSPPSFPDHILGVDALGRDVFSMLLASTRPTFTLAITAAITTAVVSGIFGALGAYYRGPLDAVLSNLSDALLLLPIPIVMVILGSRFYADIGTIEFGLLYGLLAGASSAAIVMRSHALTLMTKPFIEAARVSGAGAVHIITRHLLPHMLPLIVVHMMLAVTGAVVAEGFIAFLGLRTDIRLNWGAMVYTAIEFTRVRPGLPWPQLIAPSVSLSLFAAAFYFVARGLQDVSDPRLQSDR